MRRRIVLLVALSASIWLLITPWLWSNSTSSAGHMMNGHMMDDGSRGTVVNASTYYWHILPGAIGVILFALLLLTPAVSVGRWLSGALMVIAVWAAVGPWVLPGLGLGHSMNMGVTRRSLLIHVAPGAVLFVCAVASFLLTPAPEVRRATRFGQPASQAG